MPQIRIQWADNTQELKQRLKEGTGELVAMKAAVEKTMQSLGGQGLLKAANQVTAAIIQMGGAEKLNNAERQRTNDLLTKAIEKYRLLGQTAPAAMLQVHEATKKAAESTTSFSGVITGLGRDILTSAAGFITAQGLMSGFKSVVGGITEEFKKLTLEGAAVADVGENFQRLTSQAGLLGTTLLTTLREGTHATITDFELMKTVNQDLAAGMRLTDAQFGTLAKGAFALAQATGTDVKGALDTMNDAMLTGRTRALALLTGKIDLEKAETAYAKTLGTTRDRLSEEGKLEAARVAILDAVTDATNRLGVQTDGLDERVQQAQVAWANFEHELGRTIATSDVLEAGMVGLKDALIETFGGSQEELIKTIARAIDDAAIKLVELAQTGVTTAGFLVKEFLAVQKIFGNLTQIVEGNILVFKALSLGVAEGLGRSADIKRIKTEIDGIITSMAERGKSLKEADRLQASVDDTTARYNKTLAELHDKMVTAQKAEVAFVGPREQVARATQDAGTATARHTSLLKENTAEIKRAAEEQKRFLQSVHDAEIKFTGGGLARLNTLGMFSAVPGARSGTGTLPPIPTLTSTSLALAGGVNSIVPGQFQTSMTDQLQPSLTAGFGTLFKTAIPRAIVQSFQGGGSPIKAVGGLLGENLGTNLVTKFGSKITEKLGGVIGGGINAILPGVGSLIGPGISALVGGIKKLFGGPSAEEMKGREDSAAFQKMIADSLTAQQRIQAGGESWKMTLIGVRDAYLATGRSAADAEKIVRDLWDTKNPEKYKRAIEEIQGVLDEQKQDQADLQAALQKYGFTLDQMGPILRKQKLDEQAKELLNDWRLLVGAGIDIKTVNEQMSKAINQYLLDAKRTGTEVPAAMKPIIQTLIDQGQLVDENGKKFETLEGTGLTFSETMTEGFDRIVKRLDALLQGLGLLPAALDAIPTDKTIHIDYDYADFHPPNRPGEPEFASLGGLVTRSGIQRFAEGGIARPQHLGSGGWSGMGMQSLYAPRGSDTVAAMLTPGELVLNAAQQGNVADAIGGGSGSSPVTINATFNSLITNRMEVKRAMDEYLMPAWQDSVKRDVGGSRTQIRRVGQGRA